MAQRTMKTLFHKKDLFHFVEGPEDLIRPRMWRWWYHKEIMKGLLTHSLQSSEHPNINLYATDGSVYGTLSATASVVGPLSFSMQMPQRARSSRHAELVALVAVILSDKLERKSAEIAPSTVVLTDHKSAVLVAANREAPWVAKPTVDVGSPIQSWLYDLLKKNQHIRFQRVKAHTGETDLFSELNGQADHLAKSAHAGANHVFPYPSFCLPDYALYDGEQWV